MENYTYLEAWAGDSSAVLNDRYKQLCFGIHLRNRSKVKRAACWFKYFQRPADGEMRTWLVGKKILLNEKSLSAVFPFFPLLFVLPVLPSAVSTNLSMVGGECFPCLLLRGSRGTEERRLLSSETQVQNRRGFCLFASKLQILRRFEKEIQEVLKFQ